ncbi:hypothetical protein ACFOLJ_08785 [Rugamonas sp. CCM 8940]|uniref:hypothetical protein n=1 Tax=Rugamonas sp. CCM 8940 TaxID=2765359 RepID=UPI0018F7C686|nr:hypothetical protein [Rugamonas sp. CCM 8940]MBJ7309438.1 hypothetical protein [Rugamonas sp. CCM 8940]
MFIISEQFAIAGRALYEAQLASIHALTEAAFDSSLAQVERNVDAFRSSLAESTVATRQLLAAQRTR